MVVPPKSCGHVVRDTYIAAVRIRVTSKDIDDALFDAVHPRPSSMVDAIMDGLKTRPVRCERHESAYRAEIVRGRNRKPRTRFDVTMIRGEVRLRCLN